MLHKSMCISLGTLVLSSWLISPNVAHADKLTDYQHQQSQLQQQTHNTKQKISQLTQKEHSLQGQIDTIQGQINQLQSSITLTEADLAKRNAEIDKLKHEIAKTQVELDDQYHSLEQRIRVMYEDGQTSYFSVLFTSTSFSDLLDRLQLLSMITNQNKSIMQGIQKSKQKLDDSNRTLNQQQVQQEAVYHTLQGKQSDAETAQHTQLKLLSEVHSTKVKQEEELKGENSALSNLNSLITQLVAEEGQYTGSASGWTWPVPSVHQMSSGYGWRTWSDGSREFHNGIDIAAPVGTPIVSATAGKVLYAGPASGFGDWIVIQSAGGLLEVYGHMYSWEIRVSPGQVVQEGQQIAGVGSNGFSTGPHLHFSIANGFDSAGYLVSQNPLQYVHP